MQEAQMLSKVANVNSNYQRISELQVSRLYAVLDLLRP